MKKLFTFSLLSIAAIGMGAHAQTPANAVAGPGTATAAKAVVSDTKSTEIKATPETATEKDKLTTAGKDKPMAAKDKASATKTDTKKIEEKPAGNK